MEFSRRELQTIYRALSNSKHECQLSERPTKAENLDAEEYKAIMNRIRETISNVGI